MTSEVSAVTSLCQKHCPRTFSLPTEPAAQQLTEESHTQAAPSSSVYCSDLVPCLFYYAVLSRLQGMTCAALPAGDIAEATSLR